MEQARIKVGETYCGKARGVQRRVEAIDRGDVVISTVSGRGPYDGGWVTKLGPGRWRLPLWRFAAWARECVTAIEPAAIWRAEVGDVVIITCSAGEEGARRDLEAAGFTTEEATAATLVRFEGCEDVRIGDERRPADELAAGGACGVLAAYEERLQ